MNRQRKSSSVLASVMAVILAVPSGAWADGGRHGNDGHKNGHGNSGRYNTHYNNHSNNYYNNYYPGYKTGNRGYYPYYPCNNCDDDDDDHHDNHNNYKLWLGILGGGVAGYVLGNIHKDRIPERAYYQPANVPPPATVTRYETTYAGDTCLQQREYRSKIMVGGKQVEGYGTACLQPDGSWRYGPAQAESY